MELEKQMPSDEMAGESNEWAGFSYVVQEEMWTPVGDVPRGIW